MPSEVYRRQVKRRTPLLSQDELEVIRGRSDGNEDIARLLEHAEALAARLGPEPGLASEPRTLGPLSAVDEETHYIVEITVRQTSAK